MKILFVGDIFGSAGRRIVREHIGHVREAHDVELTIINAENAAGGFGVTPQIAEELFDMGADVLTTGNHVWDKRELLDYLNSAPVDSQERARRVLRPANMQPGLPGYGVFEGVTQSGVLGLQNRSDEETPGADARLAEERERLEGQHGHDAGRRAHADHRAEA